MKRNIAEAKAELALDPNWGKGGFESDVDRLTRAIYPGFFQAPYSLARVHWDKAGDGTPSWLVQYLEQGDRAWWQCFAYKAEVFEAFGITRDAD